MMKTAIDFLSEETNRTKGTLHEAMSNQSRMLFHIDEIGAAMERYRADGIQETLTEVSTNGLKSFEQPQKRIAVFMTATRNLSKEEIIKLGNSLIEYGRELI